MEFLVFFLLSVGIATARIPGSSSEYYRDAPPLPLEELPEPAINIHVPGTKQIDEVCGACFNPDTNSDCGNCVEGLQCVEDPQSALLPDLPSRCRLTSVTLRYKEEGDECEAFLGPSFRFDSAPCGPGLECFLQPDGPATCQLAMPPMPTELSQIKQKGEACGQCLNPSSNFNCGNCVPGLVCTRNPASAILPDAGSKCQKKSETKPKPKPKSTQSAKPHPLTPEASAAPATTCPKCCPRCKLRQCADTKICPKVTD